MTNIHRKPMVQQLRLAVLSTEPAPRLQILLELRALLPTGRPYRQFRGHSSQLDGGRFHKSSRSHRLASHDQGSEQNVREPHTVIEEATLGVADANHYQVGDSCRGGK